MPTSTPRFHCSILREFLRMRRVARRLHDECDCKHLHRPSDLHQQCKTDIAHSRDADVLHFPLICLWSSASVLLFCVEQYRSLSFPVICASLAFFLLGGHRCGVSTFIFFSLSTFPRNPMRSLTLQLLKEQYFSSSLHRRRDTFHISCFSNFSLR